MASEGADQLFPKLKQLRMEAVDGKQQLLKHHPYSISRRP